MAENSWSSSASGRRCHLGGGQARWRPDEHRATHPEMRVVRPPAATRQPRCPSSSLQSASVEDIDDDNNVDGSSGLWQLGRQDPVVVVVVTVDNDNVEYNDRIVEAEQRGRTANLTAAVFLVLVLIGVILSGVSIIVGVIGIVSIFGIVSIAASSSLLLLILTAFAVAIALASVITVALVVVTNATAAALC